MDDKRFFVLKKRYKNKEEGWFTIGVSDNLLHLCCVAERILNGKYRKGSECPYITWKDYGDGIRTFIGTTEDTEAFFVNATNEEIMNIKKMYIRNPIPKDVIDAFSEAKKYSGVDYSVVESGTCVGAEWTLCLMENANRMPLAYVNKDATRFMVHKDFREYDGSAALIERLKEKERYVLTYID